MTKFQRRKKEWFVNREGQLVKVERIPASKSSAMPLPETVMICSEKHAIALWEYHRDNIINFNDKKTT